jgi:hypothetical protein
MTKQPPSQVPEAKDQSAMPIRKRGVGWVVAIAAATFVVHLLGGLYYVSHNSARMAAPGDLRLANDAYLGEFGTWGTDHEGDQAFYNRTAITAIKTGVPRDINGIPALHAPLYSYFLGGCYAIGGINRISVAVAQSLISAWVAACLGLTAIRLAPALGPRIGWVASGMILINLHLAKATAIISPTLPLLGLFVLGLYFATGPLNTMGTVGLVGSIVFCIFTQAAFFVIAFAVAAWLAWLYLGQRRIIFILGAALIVLCTALYIFLGTLAVRGSVTARENKSLILWEANNPFYESMSPFSLWGRRPLNPWSDWRPSPAEQKRFDNYFARGEASGHNPALLWIRENPAQYLKLCWIRLYTTEGPFTGQMSPRNRAISALYWLLLFPAGFYGLWRLRHLLISKMALLVLLALTAFECLVIAEWQLRYRLPWEMILSLYAAAAYILLLSRFLEKSPITAAGEHSSVP